MVSRERTTTPKMGDTEEVRIDTLEAWGRSLQYRHNGSTTSDHRAKLRHGTEPTRLAGGVPESEWPLVRVAAQERAGLRAAIRADALQAARVEKMNRRVGAPRARHHVIVLRVVWILREA